MVRMCRYLAWKILHASAIPCHVVQLIGITSKNHMFNELGYIIQIIRMKYMKVQ